MRAEGENHLPLPDGLTLDTVQSIFVSLVLECILSALVEILIPQQSQVLLGAALNSFLYYQKTLGITAKVI